MQLDETRALALRLMQEHGLADWTFGFDRAKRRLGACWLHRKRITLSRDFVALNDLTVVRDVVLHEIAHALTPGDGHGRVFKRKARELGCSGSSCISGSSVVSSPPRFILECPHCGRSWPRYRKPARKLACGACLRSSGTAVSPLSIRRAVPD
ncbi:MAG: SprT-like domain-containing protein [Trueperaceae bacterium]